MSLIYSSPNTNVFTYTSYDHTGSFVTQNYNYSFYGTNELDENAVGSDDLCIWGPSDWSSCADEWWGACIPGWESYGWICTGNPYTIWPDIKFTIVCDGSLTIFTPSTTLLTTSQPTSQVLTTNSSIFFSFSNFTITINVSGGDTTTIDLFNSGFIGVNFTIDPNTGNYYSQIQTSTFSGDLGTQANTYSYDYYLYFTFVLNYNPGTSTPWISINANFTIRASSDLYGTETGDVTTSAILTSITKI